MFVTPVTLFTCRRCFVERRRYIDTSNCKLQKRTDYKVFSVWCLSNDNKNDNKDPSTLNGTKDFASSSPAKKQTLLDSAIEGSRQQRLEPFPNRADESLEEEEQPTSFRQFLGELWEELKQVEWPTFKQAIQELVVLSVGISVVAVMIFLVDSLFSYIAAQLYMK
jgi:preprotein translocase SecE subunit